MEKKYTIDFIKDFQGLQSKFTFEKKGAGFNYKYFTLDQILEKIKEQVK